MNRKRRGRLLAYLMILAMLCTMFPPAVLATEGSSGGAASPEGTVAGATYSVTADSAINGGSVAVNPDSGNEGDTITVTVTPGEGKQLVAGSLKYNDGSSDTEITATEGIYSFVLPAANVTVTAQFEVTVEFEAVPVTGSTVAPADFTDGILEITQGGTYTLDTWTDYSAALSSNLLGWWIQVATTEPVTIVGTDCDLEMGRAYGNMSITGTVAGIDLTVEDLFIESASFESCYTSHVVSTNAGEYDMTDIRNVLNFTGAGNKLTIEGRNCFEAKSGGAAIHVGPTAGLTVDGDGALYLYKEGAWTCIGGNGCEANGAITINGGNLFIKGSKMGAVIGSGSYCGDIPGDITINGGTLNLVGNARGAVFGTGAQDRNAIVAGNTDNFPESTGNVYVNGGLININVDYGGAAIGQADAAGSPPIFEIPGNLYVTGGSIRTFLDQNALSFWNMVLIPQLPSFGVYPVAITATKTNGSGEPVYMLALDTAQVDAAETYSVQVDGEEYYSGGLYQYCFVQEALDKGEQHSITTTVSNWVPSVDPNLYLYLTGENHTLTINGETFEATWNSESESFTVVRPGSAYTLTLTGDDISSDPVAGEIAVGTAVTITVAPAEGKRVATFSVGGVDKTADLTANQYTFNMPAAAIEVAVTYEDIPAATYPVTFSVTGENGSLTAAVDSVAISSGDEVTAGKTVVFTAAPAAGYQVKEWTVDSQAAADNKTNTLTVENLAATTTVTVEFESAAPVLNEDVYELASADHMLWFANQVNTGTNTAIKGKLMQDIDLSAVTWTPIGNNNLRKYAGTFDGNGKTVTLAISGSADYLGLFGYVDGGTVKDLNVAGSVSGGKNIGGIAAYPTGATVIENCVNNASVTSTSQNAGGIAGYAFSGVVISGCTNNGAVSGTFSVGGIVGLAQNTCTISKCANTGAITATGADAISDQSVGGIVGSVYADKTVIDQCHNSGAVNGGVMITKVGGVVGRLSHTSAEVTNCYNTGSVTSTSSSADACTGGVIGSFNNNNWTVQNTYNAGTITGNGTSPYTAGVIGYVSSTNNISNNYYLDTTASKGLGKAEDNAVSKTSDELKSSEFLTQLNGDGRFFVADTNSSNSGYPILRAMTEDTSTLISITKGSDPKLSYIEGLAFDPAGLAIWANYSDGTREKVTNYTISKTTALEITDTTITVSGTHGGMPYNFPLPITVAGPPATDSNNVYQLATADEMLWFANQVNSDLNRGIKGKLTQDIDLSAVTWKPIGNSASRKYAGAFDGDGKTVTLGISGTANSGLFGYVDGGTVKDLTVAGSVSGSLYTAGIVANAMGATVIENCVNNASVTSTSNSVGGIAGRTADTSAVKNCVNNGNVSGTHFVGGIVGNGAGTCTISKCANTGAITATNTAATATFSVGGIAGYAPDAATIDQCHNSGAVNGSVMSVGGVVGYLGNASAAVTNSYNTGSVTSTSSSATANTGGVVGLTNNAACTVQNTYNAGAVTGNGTSSFTAGVIGYANNNTNIGNNYYLDTTAEKGLGNAADNAVSKTSAELQTLAPVLGEAFQPGALYPILTWQGTAAPDTYNVTVDGAVSGGTVAVDPASGVEGTAVTVTVTPDEGKQLVAGSLTYTAAGQDPVVIAESDGVYSFVMPAADVTISAAFAPATVVPQPWDGTTKDTSWYDENEDEFTLTTGAQLAGLAAIVNGAADGIAQDDFAGKTVTLGGDIALHTSNTDYTTAYAVFGNGYFMSATYYTVNPAAPLWTPIGAAAGANGHTPTSPNYFAGTFDGAGHTVSGLYTDGKARVQGLFGCVSGEIKNLTVEGCVTAHSIAAGIAAYINGATITNCVNNAIVYADGGTTPDGGVENGQNKIGAIGGIAGNAVGTQDKPFSITNCVNNASVTCTNTNQGGRTGGMLGLVDGDTIYGSITNCANYGPIDSYQYAGGIIGLSKSVWVLIDRCFNTAKITVHSGGHSYAGGIAASYFSRISNCYNTGEITCQMESSYHDKASSVGGIIGEYPYTYQGLRGMESCYNTGALTYSARATSCSSYGTMVGANGNSAWLTKCYTTFDQYVDATLLTPAGLKGYTDTELVNLLGSAFKADTTDINDGYPILRWQVGAAEPTPSSLSIITPPTKTVYYEPEVFNPAGLKLRATYSDGSSEDVTGGFTYPTGPLPSVGATYVTIGYGGATVDQAITVHGLTSIAVTKEPTKRVYNATETFSTAGMTVTAYYSDDTSKAITNYTYSPTDGLIAGTEAITISYGSKTTTQPITVHAVVLGSIAIQTAPTKTWYLNGDTFDKTGMAVRATYDSTAGGTVVQTLNAADYTVAPDLLTTGLTEVIVSYEYEGVTKTTTQPITVMAALPELTGTYYQLEDAQDLLWFANNVSIMGNTEINAKLVNTIDLTAIDWATPIGSSAYKFAGTFDGNNKSIIGFTKSGVTASYYGLFGYGWNATIKDLTVTAALAGTGQYMAAVISNAELCTLSNVTAEGSISKTAGNYTGGIAAYSAGSTFTGCVNKASITITGAGNYVGGIAGSVANGAGTFTNCVNNGVITSAGSLVGGIAGSVVNTPVAITNCHNTVAITGAYNTGGIVGSNSSTGIIGNCSNSGAVTATTTGTNPSYSLGGIAGSMAQAGTINQCYNTGALTGSNSSIGGLAGYVSNASAKIQNSYNLGSVTYTGSFATANVGGVVGYHSNANVTVQNNYNAGQVTASSTASTYIAGVTGNAAGITNVSNNYYLDTAASKAIGYNTTYTDANAAPKTATELKALASTLGTSYKAGAIYPILTWQPDGVVTYTVTVDNAVTGGSLAVTPASAAAGETITVTVTPAEGKQLVTGTLKYTADGETYTEITETAGVYSFVLPAADVTVTAQFEDIPPVSTVWDGSIDVSWYNAVDTEFTVANAAQFAGLAAIVNNKQPTSAAGAVTGINPAIPADDFLGKTVRLAADLDLGGIEVVAGGLSATEWTTPVWSGQTWTPVGSNTEAEQSNNGTIGRPFKGTFDGQFHFISNVYIPAGSQSNALFGQLGHDGVVKNIILASGYIRGDRYTAGIAGRNWGHVESCANYATVETDGDRSGGGITGVNYENTPFDDHKPWVKNSYNAGTIMKGDRRFSGGITGDNEGIIENCYNIGTGRFKPFGALMGGIVGQGHSTTAGQIINCYSLSGDGQPTAIIAYNNSIPAGSALKTQAELQATTYGSGDILTLLGAAFKADSTNINNGYPILRGQVGEGLPSMVSISIGTPPTKQVYAETEVFDPAGMVVLADYPDGSKSVVTGYTYPTTPLTAGATSVTISYQGLETSQPITVTVTAEYTITVDSDIANGVVTAPAGAVEGATVTVTVVPAEGYSLVADSLTYTAAGQDPVVIAESEGVYSFVMPAADVIVTAQFEELPPTTYSVTVDDGISGGTVSVDPATAAEGDTVTVTVTPAEGKQLVAGSLKYTADDSAYTPITATAGVYSFILPAADVTVTAQFEDETPPGDKTPPALTADTTDNTVGQAVEITFPTDAAWEAAISAITVNTAPLTQGQYTISPGAITIDAGVFTAPGDYTVTVTADGYSDAAVTQTIQAPVPGDNPQYTVSPVADEAVYEVGETEGIKTMTVKTGVTGLKYFGTLITPVVEHEGQEAVVFTHLRDGVQLSLNVTKADFDLVDETQAGFNVQAGDVVKVYIVDDLTNDVGSNPTLLQ